VNPDDMGDTLDLFALTDADDITARAVDAMTGATDAVRALRDAASSYGTDGRTLKREGRDDWGLFYMTVAIELGKVADALGRPR
jgi:hypothetical protein